MMNKKLYEQAKKNVEKRQKNKVNKEIEEEYKHLLHESQKLKADDATLKKFKELLKIAKNTKITGLGHSYMIHSIRGSLKDIIKTRIYHPSDIDKYAKMLKSNK